MRLIEDHAGEGNRDHQTPRAPREEITTVREKAHALMAGQPALMAAPVYELRADDARSYRLTTTDANRPVTLTRKGSTALTACREIILPAARPALLLVENSADFSAEDRAVLAGLAGRGDTRHTPRLHPGSLVLCGLDSVYWA